MTDPTRDSLSRCETNSYSTLYDVRSRPPPKEKKVAGTDPIHKDTLEISKDKLEKEALSRLRHFSKYSISLPGGFVRVGKYLFVGIALPPYLLLYAIPKWVALVALPTLLSFWMRVGKGGTKQVKKLHQRIIERIQIAAMWIRKQWGVCSQPIVKIFMELGHLLQHLKQMLVPLTLRMRNGMGLVRLVKKAKAQLVSLTSLPQKAFISIKNWCAESFHAIVGFPMTLVDSFKKRVNDFSNQVKTFFRGLKEAVQNAPKEVWVSFVKTRQTAKKVVDGLYNSFKWTNPLKMAIKQQLQRRSEEIKGILNKVFVACRPKLISFRQHCKEGSEKFSNWIEQKLMRLKELSNKRFFAFADLATKKAPNYFMKCFYWFLRLPLVQRVLNSDFVQIGLRGLFKAIYIAAFSLWKFLKWTTKTSRTLIAFATEKTAKFYHKSRAILSQTVHSFITYSALFLSYIGKCFRLFIYHTLIFMIMLLIMATWGIKLLGQISTKIGKELVSTK